MVNMSIVSIVNTDISIWSLFFVLTMLMPRSFRLSSMRPYSFRNRGNAAMRSQTAKCSDRGPTRGEMTWGSMGE